MSRTYQAQTVVIEGSKSGAVNPTNKFDKNSIGLVEYVGECAIATNDNANAHYIEKLEYDLIGIIKNIKIATNLTTINASNIKVEDLQSSLLRITILDSEGDFSEVNVGDSLDLITDFQNIAGAEVLEVSNKTVLIKIISSSVFTVTNSELISNENLTVLLNSPKTNGLPEEYNKRRWDHRRRYIYR